MKSRFVFLGFLMFLFGFLGGCQKPSGLERRVHPEDWLWLHGEKVKVEGTTFCMRCHPPEGRWEDAPTCTSCHPNQP